MSYSKQNFASGDILYASSLNAMDNQIAANETAIAGKAAASDMTALASRVTALEGVTLLFSDDGNGAVTASINGGGSTPSQNVNVTGVSFASNSGSLTAGNSFTLTPIFTPSNATVQTGTWATSNSSAATVANGTVSAVAEGSANITFTSTDGNYTATYALTVTAAAQPGSSNNILNPAKEQLGWTRAIGEGKYVKVEATRINGLGDNSSYQYLGCYDISDLHLSGATVVFNVRIRTLGFSKTVLDQSYKSGNDNGLGVLLSSSSATSIGEAITFPTFDESEYKYMSLSAQSAASILSMFDGDKPLYMSKKVPYSASDVDAFQA